MFYRKKICQKKLCQTIKRFEYSPLDSELKKQTDIVKNQYHRLNKIHRSDNEDDEIINKKATLKKYEESDLFYNNTLNFNKYYGMNRFNSLPFDKKI